MLGDLSIITEVNRGDRNRTHFSELNFLLNHQRTLLSYQFTFIRYFADEKCYNYLRAFFKKKIKTKNISKTIIIDYVILVL